MGPGHSRSSSPNIPYGKEPSPYFAERGYVAIFAEERGTGRSEGVMKDYFDAQSYRSG